MIIGITNEKESACPIDSLSKGELFSFMLSETTAYSEDEITKVLQTACAREYASSSSYKRKAIEEGIPHSAKAKVLKLSIDYAEKRFNGLLADIKGSENIKDGTKLIDNYEASRKSYLVAGAGVEAVNGVYDFVGDVENRGFTYSKKGVWNGRNEIFSLFKFDKNAFFISILGKDNGEGPDDDTDFYCMEEDEEDPTNQTWEASDEGVEPAPTVTPV